ncbi:tyrosine-type recombinase/integrase [Crossiella cryophila]|uniref:Integrase n=1 Tax=Crossiella cryophila TaxID=43355 RepID=A0A7W7CC99_9PSEU|nr:site-specific integrase [Crossiella cryophila]MBB4677251.1 integrase [Crossiella cryophila]
MTNQPNEPATDAQIEAARVVLDSMGLKPEDLVEPPRVRPAVPTFAEYIPVVSDAVADGARKAYGPYWKRIEKSWGERRMDELSPSDIRAKMEEIRRNVVIRRSARGGYSAAGHFVSAVRCLYRHLVDDKLMSRDDNPTLKIKKPAAPPSRRHGLQDSRLAEINSVATTTGNDPALDGLLLRFHVETACRRGGALALRACDLDPDQCLVQLHEKGQKDRWQPVSPTMMAHLQAHFLHRCGGDPAEQLFRFADGRPMAASRYDHLWKRVGKHLSWVRAQMVTAHWLRHTTLTWVERNFGYAVARAFAGHAENNDAGATSTYVRASIHEVAAALAALTGEPHPLAKT